MGGHLDRRGPDGAGPSSGFFIGKLKSPTEHYRLRSGTYEFDDPYRFPPLLTPFELYLHAEGTNHESYRMLGAQMVESDGVEGVRFAVWAPKADVVSVIGDFNRWDRTWHPMRLREAGIWEIFIPGLGEGANYKYSVLARSAGAAEMRPLRIPHRSSSQDRVHRLEPANYAWNDAAWMEARAARDRLHEPISIYEVHLESWMRGPDNRLADVSRAG